MRVVNIYFNIAAVFMCIMMLLSLAIRKNIKGRRNNLFLLLVVVISISGAADIVTNLYGSVLYTSRYNIFDQKVVNYIYFFFRNITAPLFIIYAANVLGIWHKFYKSRLLRGMLIVPYSIDVIILLINMFKPIAFGFDSYGRYFRGKLIFVLYVVAVFYMIFGTALILAYNKSVSRAKFFALICILPITGLGVVIQIYNPILRIEILSTAMMVIIATLTIQRDEEDIDRVASAQSYGAFLNDIRKAFLTERPVSVVLLNITNHSALRSTLGIETFSEVLKYISLKLTKIGNMMTKNVDIYYLNHGTFAVVNDETRYDSMLDLARLIHAYMDEPVKLLNTDIKVDVKTTCLRVPMDIDEEDMFINFANTFSDSLPDEDKVIVIENLKESKDFRIIADIDQIVNTAIVENKFFMYYQPIYSIKDDAFVSAEALIRLIDGKYGFISPGVFIPAAEESGAIHKIGNFVVDDVCRFISENHLRDYGVEYVEINLSVAQCIEPNIADRILSVMDSRGVTCDMVNLEITETAVDYDQNTMLNNILSLNSKGISFSLDDYGTGYSNISRVAKLPVEIVKFDKSLVDRMKDSRMWEIIKYSVIMLKKIGKKILVEGVEEEWQYKKFKELGCDYIQGYYFSKPLSENDYIEFVKNNNKNSDNNRKEG